MPLADLVQLFVNPASGTYSAARVARLRSAFERLGATVRICESSAASGPEILADADHVCVAGGDGTVRHVAAALIRCGSSTPLSVYPAGTVNLLAREAGYSADPSRFAERVLSTDVSRSHYPVAISDLLFLACAGVGPDSYAVDRVSLALKRRIGRYAYMVAFLRLFCTWPRHAIQLIVDGEPTWCEAFYVAKGKYYAGRWSFAPAAGGHLPALHLVALTRARRRDYMRFVVAMLRGAPVDRLPGIVSREARTIVATSDTPLPFQADGDIVGNLPMTLVLSGQPLTFR
jgi:diacylglycerol kinase family enzyme